MINKTIIFGLLFSITTSIHAITIGTAKHLPDGIYLVNYLFNYQSKKLNDSNKNVKLDNFNLNYTQYIFRPIYYKNNFVYFVTIPFIHKKIGYFNSSKSSLGDSFAAVGYFLPIEDIDIAPVLQIKFPFGEFDKNSNNNIGSDTYSIHPELYINKSFESFELDAVIKYVINFKNTQTGIKNADIFKLESVIGYKASNKLKYGPSFSYSKSHKKEIDGVKIDNSEVINLKVGADIKYFFNKRTDLLFNFMQDIDSKNTTKGFSSMLRVMFIF